MIEKISKILLKIFGSRSERLVKSYMVIAQEAGAFEETVKNLSNEELRKKTEEFKKALKNGTKPEDILTEAFAVVREAARQNVKMRHFDVQLVGGNVLYEGKIAEMATGEGKTLVATLAAYLVFLTGRKVHIVTVNDYLARRDAQWMGPVYEALGMRVGAIQADMDTMGDERRDQYDCDVTYGTNNEFGFDYLRDNMKVSLDRMVQGPLQYAIIDEVDSILIDEARTPLIISGPAFEGVGKFRIADEVGEKLRRMQENAIRETKQKIGNVGLLRENAGSISTGSLEEILEKFKRDPFSVSEEEAEAIGHKLLFEVKRDRKNVNLTDEGDKEAQKILEGMGEIKGYHDYEEWKEVGTRRTDPITQSLRAYVTFEKEKDYVVMDQKVMIVDEFTGRLMHGRQWSDGLHQAVEAKEKVPIKEETQTLATITLQNFFKLYDQIAGMTGTAATESEEFMKIYDLDVVVIPTNEPCIREDREDVIYKSKQEKNNAIVEEIDEASKAGQPVLVGTTSVEKNEELSATIGQKLLNLKPKVIKERSKELFDALREQLGLEVLNAKQHEKESNIVAKAGEQHKGRDGRKRGNVTIATNMAGRGTDIKLGEGVADIGGLHVIGTERHEARRIDNQLRGRSGRQGDKGSSQFFLSFDDDLMRIFAPEWTVKALSWIGWEEGQPIAHKRISKGIERAQKKVEERNYEIRKSLLEYDEVMDYQRKFFYSRRRRILGGEDLKSIIEEMIEATIEEHCEEILDEQYPQRCISEWAREHFEVDLKASDIAGVNAKEIAEVIKRKAKNEAENKIDRSLGEYLEDYEDPRSWDIAGLRKWAMSVFRVELKQGKVSQQKPDEIQDELIAAAAEQIDKRDYSEIAGFLMKDFKFRTFVKFARDRFHMKLDIGEFEDLTAVEMRQLLIEKIIDEYRKSEIEYPVEYEVNKVYDQRYQNIYTFENLADWANKKYNADFSGGDLQTLSDSKVRDKLMEFSKRYYEYGLVQEVEAKVSNLAPKELLEWAITRFSFESKEDNTSDAEETEQAVPQDRPQKHNSEFDLEEDDLRDAEQAKEKLVALGKQFLRKELSELERYVLIQVYDGAWKDHLYRMDHLKDSIWMRSMAEKDPKVEYKREGHRMFQEMLGTIEDSVIDNIFRILKRPVVRVGVQSVFNPTQTAHDEVGQFAMAERQRAAAQAPQGEVKVKQIRLDGPKVGRNDPCPCGSGRKYKKCCGKNV